MLARLHGLHACSPCQSTPGDLRFSSSCKRQNCLCTALVMPQQPYFAAQVKVCIAGWLLRTGHEARLWAAAVHESVVGIAACNGRKARRREHVRRVEEGAAEAVADEVLWIQRVLAAVSLS